MVTGASVSAPETSLAVTATSPSAATSTVKPSAGLDPSLVLATAEAVKLPE